MGYSYSDVFENEHEVKIANSLLMMLRGENCASTTQLVDFIERGRFRILSFNFYVWMMKKKHCDM